MIPSNETIDRVHAEALGAADDCASAGDNLGAAGFKTIARLIIQFRSDLYYRRSSSEQDKALAKRWDDLTSWRAAYYAEAAR